jgi:hypothetical protein
MTDEKQDKEIEQRIVKELIIHRPIVEALNVAGFKARLDVEHSVQNRDGKEQRGGLVELLRGSGLYLDKDSPLAKEFPLYAKDGSDKEKLYADKEVRGLVRVTTDSKADGKYDTRIDFGGIGLSFSPALDPKREGLNFESAQVLANAIRKQAGKPALPVTKAPEKMPTLAELEKAMPDLRTPPKPVEPAEVVKTLNRQFGPHGYNFKLDNGAIVSTRELDRKEKETFMSVVAAMPESTRLPLTAKYINPNAPKDGQKFRLALDPKRINQKQLDEFRQIDPDKMEKLFDDERNTRPGKPDKQSQSTPSLLEAARSAVAFNVMSTDDRHPSLPLVPGQKNSNFRA